MDSLPGFLDVIVAAGQTAFQPGDPALARLERAAEGAKGALVDYGAWIGEQLPNAGDDFALGRERLDELIALRAFDGLTTDDILAIGHEQLAINRAARRAAAAEIDPDAPEEEVLARVKADHPATFEEALAEYRDVMDRARAFIEDDDIATLPGNAPLEVVPTPKYLRKVTPFAAYFAPAAFDQPRKGIYIVTPSVDDDPGAMREHNRASISNTSIHEAYPGHHLQLSAALERPTITRLLVDAPEFVEGWGMYSEQLMREHGFDATPAHRMMLATDAIWRACRIILDIQLHRGEIGVDDGHRLPRRTDRLRATERRRRGPSLHVHADLPARATCWARCSSSGCGRTSNAGWATTSPCARFHDALLWSGSIPVSFHRRLLAGEGGGPFLPGAHGSDAGHPQHRHPGRPLATGLVAGCRRGPGVPDRPTRAHRRRPSSRRARRSSTSWTSTARGRDSRSPRRPSRTCRARSRCRSRSPAAWMVPAQIELCFAAGATRVVVPLWAVVEDRPRLDACLAIAGDWLAVGLDARPERLRDFPWKRFLPPTLDEVVEELAGAGVRRFVLSHGGTAPDPDALRRLARLGIDLMVAGGVTSAESVAVLATGGVAAVIVGEALFTGAIDLSLASQAA